jgi:hypothetical protein
MSERFKWFSSGAWLLASFFLLILPVFVPSYPGASNIILDPISFSTVGMFILSFPSGLVSFLLSPVIDLVLRVDPNSMVGMYLNVKILFALGLAQWFWIVPRLLRRWNARDVSEFSAPDVGTLPQYIPPAHVEAFDSKSRTPVERVFDDENRRQND